MIKKIFAFFLFSLLFFYNLVFAQGSLEISLDFQESFSLKSSLKDAVIWGKEVSFDILGRGKVNQNESGLSMLKGNLFIEHMIIDGRPLDDLIINYILYKDNLVITSCRWGDFSLQGKIGIKKPYDVELDLVISPIQLEDFAQILGIKGEELLLSGKIVGLVHLRRKEGNLEIKAKLHSQQGGINELEFKEANIFLEGLFPLIHFVNSWLAKEDNSYMNIDGKFDLTKLSDLKSPVHNVRLIPVDKRFQWLDWTMSIKEGLMNGINLRKAISEDIALNMNTFTYDSSGYSQDENSIGIEYKIRQDQKIKMYLKDDEEIVGWEQAFKF